MELRLGLHLWRLEPDPDAGAGRGIPFPPTLFSALALVAESLPAWLDADRAQANGAARTQLALDLCVFLAKFTCELALLGLSPRPHGSVPGELDPASVSLRRPAQLPSADAQREEDAPANRAMAFLRAVARALVACTRASAAHAGRSGRSREADLQPAHEGEGDGDAARASQVAFATQMWPVLAKARVAVGAMEGRRLTFRRVRPLTGGRLCCVGGSVCVCLCGCRPPSCASARCARRRTKTLRCYRWRTRTLYCPTCWPSPPPLYEPKAQMKPAARRKPLPADLQPSAHTRAPFSAKPRAWRAAL